MAAPILIEDIASYPHKYEELVQVVIRSDDDGHEYLIPKKLEAKFETLNSLIYDLGEDFDNEHSNEAYSQFETLFNHLRMEGNQPPLYAKIGYEKEL